MARSLLAQAGAHERASAPSAALFAKGFRPFFLLAAVFAIAIVPLWLTVIGGGVRPTLYLDPIAWHAHEMIFGFAVAVIAGFLLTAVGTWTNRETLVGLPLAALAVLWVLGRGSMLFAGALPRGVPALVDLAFLPFLLLALGRPIIAARNRRNVVMLAIVAALFAANVFVHLDALGVVRAGTARRACLASVDIVLLVIVIVAGRVFPMFTRNATGVGSIRSIASLDVATIVAMVGLALSDLVSPETRLSAGAAGLAAVLAAARMVHWGTLHTLRHPLLWILHAGHVWLILGLFLRSAAGFGVAVPSSLGTHALTVGAIGSLTIGMMSRVALGHTGRMLVASRAMTWAFAAVNLAAAARVFLPLFAPGESFRALFVAGASWTAAFTVFLVVYAPILTSHRVDGKAG